MAHPNGFVPQDMWVCCKCGGPNVIAIADAACPVCNHYRDETCSGPGAPIPDSNWLFPDISNHRQSYNPPYYPNHNGYTREHAAHPTKYTAAALTEPLHSYFQSEQGDMWKCSECGADNCDWYDVCPICNRGTKTSTAPSYSSLDLFRGYPAAATSPPWTSYPGAGSPAQGSWICGACGTANSDLTPDFCPACGSGR